MKFLILIAVFSASFSFAFDSEGLKARVKDDGKGNWSIEDKQFRLNVRALALTNSKNEGERFEKMTAYIKESLKLHISELDFELITKQLLDTFASGKRVIKEVRGKEFIIQINIGMQCNSIQLDAFKAVLSQEEEREKYRREMAADEAAARNRAQNKPKAKPRTGE